MRKSSFARSDLLVGLFILAALACPPSRSAASELSDLDARARRLEAQGKYTEALELQQKAAALAPGEPGPHRFMAFLYGRLGEPDKALEHSRLAYKLAPNDYKSVYNLAIDLQMLGRYREAIGFYEKAQEMRPDDHQPSVGMGQCLIAINQRDAAVEHFEALTARFPGKADVLENLATAYFRTGRETEGVATVRKALAIEPDNFRLVKVMAITQLQTGDGKGAMENGWRLIELNEKSPDGYLLVVRLAALSANDPSVAKLALDRALQQVTGSGRFFGTVGRELILKGNFEVGEHRTGKPLPKSPWWDLSAAALKRAVELEPDSVGYRLEYARALHLTGRDVEALQQVRQVLKLDPTNRGARRMEAILIVPENDLAGSIREWLKTYVFTSCH